MTDSLQHQYHIIDKFIEKQKQKVAELQSRMVKDALDSLFRASPHAGGPGEYSDSEYDANHKLSINHGPTTPHIPATHSRSMSSAILATEKLKANLIQCGDLAEITNDTEHAIDVELGGSTWRRPGYKPFQKTINNIKEKYNNVFK